MKKKIVSIFFLLFLLASPMEVFGKIGVGIGTAKIELNEVLNPGSIHSLQPLSVVNTGDEATDYEVGIEFQENVSEMRPQKEWFVFSPTQFQLEPKENKIVEISLNLPVKVVPGKYFAYLEARPLKKVTNNEGAAIGIAAAAKLYFEVKPASFLSGIYYKLLSLWKKYSPWTWVVSVILAVSILLTILSRFVTFNIGIGKKEKKYAGRIVADDVGGPESMEDILSSALHKVEKYTSQLSENRFEEVFAEARMRRQSVIDFFYKNDASILREASIELKNILLLSKDGLEAVKPRGKDVYEKILRMVVSGLIG